LACYWTTTYCCWYENTRLDLFIYLFIIFIKIGTWLKQRNHEQKQKEEDKQIIKESNDTLEKSSQSSSANSSSRSSIITNGEDINSSIVSTKIKQNRSYSATLRGQRLLPDKPSIIKEIVNNPTHPWEYDEFSNQSDLTGPLTKSALIYRLMRSRLEANLAKSITANKKKSSHKKKLSSSTTTWCNCPNYFIHRLMNDS
jgi:hypothetical protein